MNYSAPLVTRSRPANSISCRRAVISAAKGVCINNASPYRVRPRYRLWILQELLPPTGMDGRPPLDYGVTAAVPRRRRSTIYKSHLL
ncbi:unnamed protein product, partial [Iphiclides podalirius]